MAKVSKKSAIDEQTKRLATAFIDGIINKDKKSATSALKEMVNNRISAKIRKVARTEELI
jgi:hypothetical protein